MISNEQLLSLADTFGTPLYIIDESEIEKNQQELDNAFSVLPIPVKVAYPYKANSIINVLEYMRKKGRWAEVASELELNLALNVGIEPQNIILNSPHKPLSLLKLAVAKGCKIHIDNEHELIELSNMVSQTELTEKIEVGLRISTPGNSLWSRFGLRNREVDKAIDILINNDKFRLVSLHTHRSSIVNLSDYKQHIEQIFNLSSRISKEYGVVFDYLDIGSGFAIDWPKPIGESNWLAPSLAEYAHIVNEAYQKHEPHSRELIIEPGRKSVASSGILLTKVVGIKERGETRYIICDGALNFLPGAEIYSYKISRVNCEMQQGTQASNIKNVLCGCLCDSLDVLDPQTNIYNPEINQIIKVEDVGGYDIARSFIWQLPYPQMVWVSQNRHHLINSPRRF